MKQYAKNIQFIDKVMETSITLLTQLEMYHKYQQHCLNRTIIDNNNIQLCTQSPVEENIINDIDDNIKMEKSSENDNSAICNFNKQKQNNYKSKPIITEKLPQYGFINNIDKSTLSIVATKDRIKDKTG